MPNGHHNKRVDDLERTTKRIEAKVNRLESLIGQPRQENQTSNPPQETSRQHDDAAQGQPTLKPQIPPSPNNSNQSEKPWYKTLNGWKIVLEVVGIPFAIGYAVVTYYQWQDLRHNFETDERAWVKYDPDHPNIDSGKTASLPGTLTNVGKSTILIIQAQGVYEVVDANSTPSFNLKTKPHSRVTSTLMFPNEKVDFPILLMGENSVTARPLTADELQRLHSGKAYIAAFGLILYKDAFGMHWYRFCDWTLADDAPAGHANAGPCTEWNDIGDGTPQLWSK